MNAAELLERLRRHYLKPGPFPGGVFVDEVQNAAGTNRCDAVFAGFTATSGRMLIGHELKVSRADWRHELDRPDKAQAWADQCHAWYVVAPSVEVVPPAELPHGWGLLTVNPRTRTRLDVTVRAAVHADRIPSWDTVRAILARNDTLRARAIADGIAANEQKLGAELTSLRAARRRVQQGMDDRDVEATRAILKAATTQLRLEGHGAYIDHDDIVRTVVDLTGTKTVLNQLRNRVSDLHGALRTLQAGMVPTVQKWADELATAQKGAAQ